MPTAIAEGRFQAVKFANNDEFRRVLSELPAAAYICNSEGLITYFNDHAARLWGRQPKLSDADDRFCGSFKLLASDGSPIQHDQCWMAQALREDQEYIGEEIVVERPDGSRRTALAHVNPFRDDSGRICGAVNVLVDVTDRKQTEDSLRDADRRKTEFLATLAHELRNPLAPIRSAVEYLRLQGPNEPGLNQARDVIVRQVDQLGRLVDDLLDLSRITSGKIELRKDRINLVDVLHGAVDTSRPLIEACGHELSIDLPEQQLFVDADRIRLTQVFVNLLNNSAKYTERGGHIRLILERQGSDVVVKVQDDGVGIPADMLPKVFDMFTQVDRSRERSQGGLGIGLSLVRALVGMHDGSVEAHSAGRGRGSEFVVRLSAVLPTTQRLPDRSRPVDSRPTCKYRILVVDDNQDGANSLAMLLRILGHDLRTAYDGMEALELLVEHSADVILLDIGLPKLNGFEVCRQIRQQSWGEGIVIVALSGWSQEQDKAEAKAAGFDYHMVKPVAPDALSDFLAGLPKSASDEASVDVAAATIQD